MNDKGRYTVHVPVCINTTNYRIGLGSKLLAKKYRNTISCEYLHQLVLFLIQLYYMYKVS